MESYKLKTSHYNHKIFSKSKTNIAPVNCKKHPKHKQSPGVCSLCVNKKLFLLSNSSLQQVKKNPQSASSLSDISSLSSSCSSPSVKHATRIDSSALKSFKVYGRNALKKSKSMAFGLTSKKEEKGNKSWLWSKFFSGKNKRLMHSRTTREKESLRFATHHIG